MPADVRNFESALAPRGKGRQKRDASLRKPSKRWPRLLQRGEGAAKGPSPGRLRTFRPQDLETKRKAATDGC